MSDFWKKLLIGQTLSSCTFNTQPFSSSVTMNKPVNRIFQSRCGVLFSEETFSQRRRRRRKKQTNNKKTGYQLSSTTEPEVTLIQWKIKMIPFSSSRNQQHGLSWHLVDVYLHYIHHNCQVSLQRAGNTMK